jgi:hypothetical protein
MVDSAAILPFQTGGFLHLKAVSRPLLRLLLGDIGFVYPGMSMVVIGPSLPILRKTKTVESAV